MRTLVVPALAAALLGTAAAQTDPLRSAGSETRSMFFTDCYSLEVMDPDGALTVGDLDDDSQPKRLRVTVLYDGDLPNMPEGWTEEIMPVLSVKDEQTLRAAYGELSEGDEIALDYAPGEGSTLTRNGEPILSHEGYALTAAMLDVWFGESPVDEDIKEAFLGG